MLKRTLISVGQGSFNIEQIGNKKIIYDCGSTRTSLIKAQIDKYIVKDETIDVLVISHLDKDHYSGVAHLFSRAKIKMVLLPYINNIDAMILWNNTNKMN